MAVLAIVILTFALIAPTLTWLEFSGGIENLNVATAMEILREDRWLVPTLQGEPRVAKPPLTAWITATAISDETFRWMSDPRGRIRDAAEAELAWEVRWPFLLSSCLMLLAAAELGRVLGGGDGRIAAIAAAACASNLFFLRHGRMATTDVQLALWVALANVCIAHAVMRGRWWRGALGAGFFLGLAFMSKGPVALVQSVAPLAVFVLCDSLMRPRHKRDGDRVRASAAASGESSVGVTDTTPWGIRTLQLLLAIAIFTLVALPWYAIVASKNPDVWARWQVEVTREGATALPAGRWYAYISLFAFIAPWTAFLIAGIVIIIVQDAASSASQAGVPMPSGQARGRGMLLALLMLLVPVVIMSFFRDRKERYLLPMIVPASVVIARAVIEHVRTRHLRSAADRAVVAIHWAMLLLIAVGLPVAGAVSLKTLDGGRWFSPALAAAAAVVGATIVLGGIIAHRRWPGGIVAATLLLMLGAQMLFVHGYRASREGRSEMKPLAAVVWQHAPDAAAYTWGTKQMRAPSDLSIYLNRSVLWVDDASQIPPSDRPAVLVVRQREHEGPPPPPPGMTLIGKTERDESWWHVFLRPGKAETKKD